MSTKKEIAATSHSTDVNDYLGEITGKDITAKHFRTWAGTVLAAMALNELESFDSAAQAKRSRRHRKGLCTARQHADHLPQMLRPS
jgi:DNA topoisomerase IB